VSIMYDTERSVWDELSAQAATAATPPDRCGHAGCLGTCGASHGASRLGRYVLVSRLSLCDNWFTQRETPINHTTATPKLVTLRHWTWAMTPGETSRASGNPAGYLGTGLMARLGSSPVRTLTPAETGRDVAYHFQWLVGVRGTE